MQSRDRPDPIKDDIPSENSHQIQQNSPRKTQNVEIPYLNQRNIVSERRIRKAVSRIRYLTLFISINYLLLTVSILIGVYHLRFKKFGPQHGRKGIFIHQKTLMQLVALSNSCVTFFVLIIGRFVSLLSLNLISYYIVMNYAVSISLFLDELVGLNTLGDFVVYSLSFVTTLVSGVSLLMISCLTRSFIRARRQSL